MVGIIDEMTIPRRFLIRYIGQERDVLVKYWPRPRRLWGTELSACSAQFCSVERAAFVSVAGLFSLTNPSAFATRAPARPTKWSIDSRGMRK
jgi:hypothetical protein